MAILEALEEYGRLIPLPWSPSHLAWNLAEGGRRHGIQQAGLSLCTQAGPSALDLPLPHQLASWPLPVPDKCLLDPLVLIPQRNGLQGTCRA